MRVEMPGPAISFQAYATAGHQMQRCWEPASPYPQRGHSRKDDAIRCQAVFFMLSGSGGVPSMALDSGWGRVPSMRSRSHLQ
eukprot:16306009-Heterocapsa_arctica.AAC.1